MATLTTVIFVLLPPFGVLLSILNYSYLDKKKGPIYATIMALFLALIFYNWIPYESYDLYRHHLVVYDLMGKSFRDFLFYASWSDLEIIPLFFTYIIALIGNVNLLQFCVVFLGYLIMFYLLHDYRKQKKLKNIPFLLVSSFTFLSFNILYFVSGLWNYLAIIIFFFALYNEYIKGWNKMKTFPIYIFTFFVHTSMLFPLVILIIYKFFKNKLTIGSIFITCLIFIAPGIILGFLNDHFNINILIVMQRFYNTYFTNNPTINRLYGGTILYMELLKVVVILLSTFMQKERMKFSDLNGFGILLVITIILTLPQSLIMIRFVMLFQLIGIISMMDLLLKINNRTIIYFLVLFGVTLFFAVYVIRVMSGQDFGNLFSENLWRSIFSYL